MVGSVVGSYAVIALLKLLLIILFSSDTTVRSFVTISIGVCVCVDSYTKRIKAPKNIDRPRSLLVLVEESSKTTQQDQRSCWEEEKEARLEGG